MDVRLSKFTATLRSMYALLVWDQVSLHTSHILLQRSPNVQVQSLPTTLIEVHSIRERFPVFSQVAQLNNLLTALAKHQRRPVDLLDCPKKLDLLSDLVNWTDISEAALRGGWCSEP